MKVNMEENFKLLESRLSYSLYHTDLEKINYYLRLINDATIVTGVGGSSIVAAYVARVLNLKNNIITRVSECRDLKYLNLINYKNIIACSYSGSNYGTEISFDNELKHYLLSTKELDNVDYNLTYNIDSKEKSFIALSSTLIPCSILLNYYLNNEYEYIIDECIDEYTYSFDTNFDALEIFTGLETSTASKYLESTLVEAGIGLPIIHDKYSFCHGRHTLCTKYNNVAIIYSTGTELDEFLINEIKPFYKDIVIIKSSQTPIGEYKALVASIYLTKYLASSQNKDLSIVEHSPIARKLYNYHGKI